LDELLQKAANGAGRSVSEEIEYRLDRSFYGDGLRDRIVDIVKLATREAVGDFLHAFQEHQEATKERREDRAQMGAPLQRWEVIPLRNPVPETPEPKVPQKKTEPESETVKSEGAEEK
jgi:hypothetical protein